MKAGIVSLVIGILGLLVITYFYTQSLQEYQEIDEGTSYVMSSSVRIALLIVESAGAILGFLSYKKWRVRTGLLGLGLCTLNLILVFYPF